MKRANLVEFVLELGLLEVNFDVVEKVDYFWWSPGFCKDTPEKGVQDYLGTRQEEPTRTKNINWGRKLTNLLWECSGDPVEPGEGGKTNQTQQSSMEGNFKLSVEPLHNPVRLRLGGSSWRVNYSQNFA